MPKFYVSTAIDYVNAAPHIGHAYEKIAADILARYYRLKGYEVFFLTGVDEHGLKVEKAAKAANITPETFCDQMSVKFIDAWQNLSISYDHFFRTTEERHIKVVQAVFSKMKEKGDIYKGKYSGLYCEGCEDNLRERDLDENGHCPNHKKKPVQFTEENYFFALSKYKDVLKKWLSETQDVVKPDGRRKEVLHQLEDEDFKDFSISRSTSAVKWGIPVPGDPEQVIYVWIDALTNYITGVGYLTNDEMWEHYWPADLHLIGKDITKFHAIYWPAMLMSLDIQLPKLIFGHGFITVEGQKMSKSLGNVIDPIYLCQTYGADPVRYFLFAANSFDQDGDFSKAEFINLVNSHLANNLGNLLNRILTLLQKNCDGKVPSATLDHELVEFANVADKNSCEFMEQLEFAKSIEAIFSMVNEANKFLNDQKPWALFKEGKTNEGASVLLNGLYLLKRVALLLYPVTPKLANDIWHQMGFDGHLHEINFTETDRQKPVPNGQTIRNQGPVFMRIEETASVS
jgi:methionyl-tRNA synthetase